LDAFNKPAADTRPAAEKLLEAIANTRRNVALVDAVTRRDWAEAAKLRDDGASINHRDRAALKAMSSSDETGAADFLEKCILPNYPLPYGYTLIAAIKSGNRASFDHILQKKMDDRLLNDALFTALREDKKDMADELLKRLPQERYNDAVVFAFFVHRPDDFDKLAARFPDMQDNLMLFANACAINNVPAMEKSMKALAKESDTVLRRLQADDWFDHHRGAAIMREISYHVLETGHLPTIDAFLDAFSSNLTPDFMMIAAAAGIANEHPQVLSHMLDRMKVPGDFAASIVASSASSDRAAAAKIVLDKYPDEAKKMGAALLRVLAGAKDEQDFLDAQAKGLELPADGKQRAHILARALEAGNLIIAAEVEKGMAFGPEEIDTLQLCRALPAKALAAEKTGDWHNRKDDIFWTALSDKRRDIADKVPNDVPLAPPDSWRLSYALGPVIEAKDWDFLGKTLARTAWDDATAKAAFEACEHSAEAVKQAYVLNLEPRELNDSDINRIVGKTDKAPEILAALFARGYTLPEKTASYALTRALVQDCPATTAYLLGQGIKFDFDPNSKMNAMENGANAQTLDIAERWIVRAEKKEAVLDESPVEKQALAAAYGDCMAQLLKKVSDSFNPESLASIKDNKGNTVLEILGAHGRLNDLLVPELWKDRDAESFIKSNTPPCYHAQCDFAALSAGIAHIRLKERAAGLKFKLK
jgi:hypothetical protein